MNKLAIIIPCYNEEECLLETAQEIKKTLFNLQEKLKISQDSFIYFVDDGSVDKTWEIISNLHKQDSKTFKGLKFSRNFGHQNAVFGGLFYTKEKADFFVTIDADLQDDVLAIEGFLDAFYNNGSEIVYGVRKKRATDTFFKKTTARFFYKLMLFMGVKIVYNHADYRFASKRAIENLFLFNEVNLFLRGIFPLIGFKTETVFYDRKERKFGESKYGLKKMISFAWDGITSFSVAPLRFFVFLSLLILILSIILGVYFLIRYFIGKTITGWTSLAILILFLGSLQCLGIGILGEYMGKIYKETKARPRFIKDMELF
ncbi:MAG: glycosyltransferase family 2 protein [Patescibacteria group bacterium]|nr:glycosyltransferase family 2 protein [Patescibacteria group bacterium]